MDVVTIGEFARLTRLSPKALRLYDELGLLPPARVDPSTGYRFYTHDQLGPAGRLASLRQIGVPLALAKEILAADGPSGLRLVSEFWHGAETLHNGRRELARYLIQQMQGDTTM